MCERCPQAVGLLGGGVIGGGWAARFVLNGIDVRLYGPSSGAVERVQKMLANARRTYQRLTQVPLPAEGALIVVDSVADAVRGVELVQESAPERLELKQQLLADASRAAAPETLICSSTSGLRPSLLQAGIDHPERLLVAHPFNPVHLLPLVELCAGQRTAHEALARAAEIYRAVGMHPLIVRKEVDGFIANRLQEAIWREALWLVHEDVATMQEVDEAIRYSFGLRRAVIGPFRIVGDGIGIRRFLEKWGSVLNSPWTKSTDAPELSGAFLSKLVEQADAQTKADNLTIAELEQKRDDCLTAVLQALRAEGFGAGETLARWEQRLRDRLTRPADGSGPLRTPVLEMHSDWLDHNGHISEWRYLQLFSNATETLLSYIGVDSEYRSKSGSYYTVQTNLSYLRELYAGDRIEVLTHILGADDKRLHIFHVVTRESDEGRVATCEQMLLHVDAVARRSRPVQGKVRERMLELARLHAELSRPEPAGTSIGLR
ncbi:3-hydroxyacyl-CoA dehydrogenase NAD-binding domain-containing protein [Bradyrhizobium huanghuaihaiense]|nr:3-hydroxyacyl-CoA dehydrogenase NAD-binding domain-containing protein [Bradyrhizobium sp. CB3035]